MFTTTDYIVILCLLYFFYSGWRKGFFRTILGPIALILCSIASYIYYLKTGNILISIAIGLLGPIAFNIILSVILKLSTSASEKEKVYFSPGKFLGGLINTLWVGAIIIITLVLITFIPLNFSWYITMKDDINKSRSFAFISMVLGEKLNLAQNSIQSASDVFENEQKQEKLRETQEFQDILADDTFKELLADEESLRQLQEKDISKLLTNPKIKRLTTDKDLLKKLFAFQRQIIDQNMLNSAQLGGGEFKKEKTSGPQWWDFEKNIGSENFEAE